ncbi:MAG: SDR family NAD(P)-dependent oxidoreductase [Acidobacteria bacterium]|nr:SDR family NAD(P)-dependent oxidoreductase [Acidobacteriota bacterium]
MPGKYDYSLLESALFFAPARYSAARLKTALAGKTVLITGASYGIGEELVDELAGTGAHLILVARTGEKLEALKKLVDENGGRATVFAVDLTKKDEVEELLGELGRLPAGVDVFVSNAGKSIRRPLYESLDRFHDFERTMALNYFAPVRLALGLIPALEKNKGQIVNVSAVNTALAPAPYWAAYQASKTAFDQWFRCAAPELERRGIAPTSVYLPLVRTRMIEPTAAYRNAPAMHPRHVARIICRLLLTRRRRFAPWWLFPAEVASAVFRRPWEAIAARFVD